ncbi:SDR family oxidoreductase [Mesorhizobium sp. M0222]|uniref:SDR family oxidoreductase n=1 Tax=Mesorhizobium sp. M0222 TaxID=2956921 RepID=UPI00333AFD1B
MASTPLERRGRPEEVAQTMAYLCSDWASFITGETVHINGDRYIASWYYGEHVTLGNQGRTCHHHR